MKQAVKVRQYWENLQNLSMPDKNILGLEIQAIKKLLGPGLLCWMLAAATAKPQKHTAK